MPSPRLVRAIFAFCLVSGAARAADGDTAPAAVPRHPLELEALVDPEHALREIEPALAAARARNDMRQVALLALAQANACRVVADWSCQRDAGNAAYEAAQSQGEPLIEVRGLIAAARGEIALQDFSLAERRLGMAELLLASTPEPVLLADVFLAYSSLSYSLGKHALAIQYADRGLASLAAEDDVPMRVRLLRNRARAQSQLGKLVPARESLDEAVALVEKLVDPKLAAEIQLEAARVARLSGDVEAERASGARVLELAGTLKNSQLLGQGHEVLGLAASDRGELDAAARELELARGSFHQLKLERDELRVVRELAQVMIRAGVARPRIDALVARLIELDVAVAESDRAKAAADFDARLKYAQSEIEVARLKDEALLASERAAALERTNRLRSTLIALALALVLALALAALMFWRAKHRVELALKREHESEVRYRMLADNARDLVVRMRPDGTRLYISPSAREMLGYDPAELMEPRWELVHPDDREKLVEAIGSLVALGGTATVVYRIRHRDGHYVWLEALARRVLIADGSGAVEIVYSGRDISARMNAEQALADSERRLRAVADNVPAMIAHLDAEERYLFINAYSEQVGGIDAAHALGRTLRDVRGETVYRMLEPHIRAALAGETVRFEGEAENRGRHYYFLSNYVPDVAPDGKVRGLYSVTYDITARKLAELELERLARIDGLSGVSNRRSFEERLAVEVARGQRHGGTTALLVLDIDHFKRINDSYGHLVGDDVIREFASRLESCVRQIDFVARIGGDEFAVLLDGMPDAGAAELIARKLVVRMAEPVLSRAGPICMGTSVGVAFSAVPLGAEQLMALADEALYAAKDAGRGTFCTRVARARDADVTGT